MTYAVRPLADTLASLHAACSGVWRNPGPAWTSQSPTGREIDSAEQWCTHIIEETYSYVLAILDSAADHLRAMADLLYQPHGFLPDITLARSVVELSARARYLLEPDIGWRERARRYMNERLFSLNEQVRLLSGAALETDEESARILEMLSSAQGHGFPVRPPREGRLPSVGDSRPSGMQLLQGWLTHPDGSDMGRAVYRAYSSVVHGVMHGLSDDMWQHTEKRAGSWRRNNPFDAAPILVGAPLIFVEAIERASSQFGWDSTDLRSAINRVLIIWQVYVEVSN
jgi:hypothetical protein